MDPSYRDLQNCLFPSSKHLKHFRQLVVNLVMATDIFDKDLKAMRESRWEKAFLLDNSFSINAERALTVEQSKCSLHYHQSLKATIVIEHILQAVSSIVTRIDTCCCQGYFKTGATFCADLTFFYLPSERRFTLHATLDNL